MALMADGGAHDGRPVADEKHDERVVIRVVVSVALSQAVYDKEENALQIKVETAEVLEPRNNLIWKRRD